MGLIASSAEVLAAVDDAWGWLSVPERQRAGGFGRAMDRDDFVAAHVLVRQRVGALTGIEGRHVTIVQWCDNCAAAHGPPAVAHRPDIYVSIAHSRGWVAAVASERPCGIDVENVAELRELGIVGSALTPTERTWVEDADDPVLSFARLWVRKEALVKAGAAQLDEVTSINLVDDTGLLDVWQGHRLTGLEGPASAVGAVAAVA